MLFWELDKREEGSAFAVPVYLLSFKLRWRFYDESVIFADVHHSEFSLID